MKNKAKSDYVIYANAPSLKVDVVIAHAFVILVWLPLTIFYDLATVSERIKIMTESFRSMTISCHFITNVFKKSKTKHICMCVLERKGILRIWVNNSEYFLVTIFDFDDEKSL